ncbi:MAG: ABC transporter substrate-binding protein [Cyanothece sp. SIO2G6]|nr:ABC transporter substrate-binding protein [Cyanothece sp. SIO2G6]
MARYAVARFDSPKVMVFYNSNSNYSNSLSEEFINELGRLNVVLPEDPDVDLSTWSENPQDWPEMADRVISKARRNQANVFMLAISAGQLPKALEIVRLNQREFPLLGGDDVYSPDTLVQGQDNALGMVVAVASDAEGSRFSERSSQLWGTADVNWRTITAYDAVQALMRAIDGQEQPTREGVQEELSSPNFSAPGAIDIIRFREDGDYDGDAQLVEVQKDDEGRYYFRGIDNNK